MTLSAEVSLVRLKRSLLLVVCLLSSCVRQSPPSNLASAYTEDRNWSAAEQTIDQVHLSSAPQDDFRLSAELQLNKAAILTGRGNYSEALALYQDLLRSKTADPAVLWQAHADLAALYVQCGQSSAARDHFDQALRIIERTRLSLLQNDYQISFLDGLIRFYQQYIDLLVNEGDYWRALEIADSSRARALTEKLGVETKSGFSTLSPAALAQRTDAVILFYCLQPKRSYLWLIANGQVKLLHLPAQEVISSLVKKHQTAIRNLWDPSSLSLPSSRHLASLLLEPAKPYLNASQKILIIPDGALYDLSFDTLPDGDHYWIDQATIAIAPSLHMLDRKAPAAVERRSLLLIGDPDPQPSGFAKLAFGGAEIKAIQDITRRRPALIHAGARARPSAYRASFPSQFAFIHFTAHVVPNAESPLDSAIILSPDRPDHFKLYARDVLEYPLTAELVTVSGCSSAGARLFAGEGLIGFAWAFLRAGAQSFVGGLWDVDDRSTAQLMKAMYNNLESGDKPVRALHKAKLTLRRSSNRSVKPYHWAAFQIYVRSYQALRP